MMADPPVKDGADHVNRAVLVSFTRLITRPCGASEATKEPAVTTELVPAVPSEPIADTRNQ